MKLRIHNNSLLFEDIPQLCDGLEQWYWIQDTKLLRIADEESQLSDCTIVNCECDTIFGDLCCWGHAHLIVKFLNSLDYRFNSKEGKESFCLPLPETTNDTETT